MTYGQAFCAFVFADATLAAKLVAIGNVKIGTLQQNPGDCNAVVKIVSSVSRGTLAGATSVTSMRVEVTFWCKLASDAESMGNRLFSIMAGLNGQLVTSGPTFKVFQLSGPRTLTNPDNRYYGAQLDIIGHADMSTT